MKYALIYGVYCRDIKVTAWDKYGAYIQYKVKNGRKLHKCWVDFVTVQYLKKEGLIT